MHRTLSALVLAAAALTAACDSPSVTGPPETDPSVFAAYARDGLVTLTNHDNERVYFRLVERNALATASWFSCTRPEWCPSVAPGQRVRLPYKQIAGYDRGDKEAFVLTNRMQPQLDGTYVVTDAITILVFLR